MVLVCVVLLAAVLVGRLAGGDLDRLGRLPLRGKRLVLAGWAAQLVGTAVGGPAYPAGLALSALLAVGFLVANRGARGTGLVGLGVAANALVVGLNGAMPVSLDAAARAGIGTSAILLGEDPRHEVADDRTRLRALSDVVPVPLPSRPQVVSPGDVLVAAGLAQLVVVGMRTGGRRLPR
ncbi:MAG: hypothetical protein JWN57_192 [Frankiales bacterium]|nr:hypothetical protein [Frankiales bacterium]